MSLNLSGATAQSQIKEIFFFSEVSECNTYIAFKVIPSQAKLLIGTHCEILKKTLTVLLTTDLVWYYVSVCKTKILPCAVTPFHYNDGKIRN